MFRSSCVKPVTILFDVYRGTRNDPRNVAELACGDEIDHNNTGVENCTRISKIKKQDSRAVQSIDCYEKLKEPFAASRAMELLGLIKNETFQVVKRDDIKRDTRIVGSSYMDASKNTGGSSNRYQSRLVAQNYEDKDSAVIAAEPRPV